MIEVTEEKKDEMKNRISLALKDPTLQQCFEIICKENAELKSDNDARKFAMAMSEKVEKQLREENAELKEYNKYLKRKRQGGIQKQYNKVAIIKQQDEQLTKAKEIIKGLLELGSIGDGDYTYVLQAEQFLKEE